MLMWLIRIALFAVVSASWSGYSHAQTDIKDIFQSSLTCALVSPLLADMPVEPVYAQDGTQCISVVPDAEQDSRYFADDNCQTAFDFEATTLSSHCDRLLDSTLLGEGPVPPTPNWTLPPGARMDLGARSLDGVTQPYMQRLIYRSIESAAGLCNLEMRVYSPHPNAQAKGSVLAFHGGSWSGRGFGFFGLELTIPHFIEKGFVVYAPFYRLLEDAEGSAACHNATITQITEDASQALAWVQEHAVDYGSSSLPVVFGQSAGAHMAASLLINEPESVAAAVLFYPPTDFTDFALRASQGFYTNEQGLGILDSVIGVSPDEADISASPIAENSFPVRIVEDGLTVPPVMMVHGMADELVEPRQSVRLCDALAGRSLMATDEELAAVAGLREIQPCGENSELQLIREGQHALDVCVADAALPTDLCPSGSEASRDQVALAIGDATSFAASRGLSEGSVTGGNGQSPVAGESSGSGSLSFWWFTVLLPVAGRSWRRY